MTLLDRNDLKKVVAGRQPSEVLEPTEPPAPTTTMVKDSSVT